MEGVIFALTAAVASSVVYTVLAGPLGTQWTARVLIAGLGVTYVLYLLHRSRERTGRTVSLVLWLSLAGLSWLAIEDLSWYLAAHLAMVWLVRILYHQPGPLAALLDLGLQVFALMAGLWAFMHAHSVFLGTWTFFLVQALFTAIPALADRRLRAGSRDSESPDHFQQAYCSAELAVRKLSAHQ
jgi:hypothetical protein